MEPQNDFLTSEEAKAFDDEATKPSTGNIAQDVKDIWFAAREFFTGPSRNEISVQTEQASVPYGYFDERRAQVRLQIMPFTSGNIEQSKKIEAWVFGEES